MRKLLILANAGAAAVAKGFAAAMFFLAVNPGLTLSASDTASAATQVENHVMPVIPRGVNGFVDGGDPELTGSKTITVRKHDDGLQPDDLQKMFEKVDANEVFRAKPQVIYVNTLNERILNFTVIIFFVASWVWWKALSPEKTDVKGKPEPKA